MLQKLKIILALLIVAFTCELSYAQEDAPMSSTTTTTTVSGDKTTTKTVHKERRAQLNFEDELVEGATQKPELFYLFQKKNFNYKRLVKLRENFLPEMRRSAEDVQRVRGGN